MRLFLGTRKSKDPAKQGLLISGINLRAKILYAFGFEHSSRKREAKM